MYDLQISNKIFCCYKKHGADPWFFIVLTLKNKFCLFFYCCSGCGCCGAGCGWR